MKKLLTVLLLSAISAVFAAAELPKTLDLTIGSVKVRLDSAKRCNVNRIEYKGELYGVDDRGFHYGTAMKLKNEKGFAGSGHAEAGYGEVVELLEILVDGKPVEYLKAPAFSGKTLQLHKISKIGHFALDYTLRIADDRIDETVSITSDADVELDVLYNFMHPWGTRFNLYCAQKQDGTMLRGKLTNGGAFTIQSGDVVTVACYDEKSGNGIVTRNLGGEGQKNATRFLWDRHVYHKDYSADFTQSTFPKGHTATYAVRTAFFATQDAAHWEETAMQAIR